MIGCLALGESPRVILEMNFRITFTAKYAKYAVVFGRVDALGVFEVLTPVCDGSVIRL